MGVSSYHAKFSMTLVPMALQLVKAHKVIMITANTFIPGILAMLACQTPLFHMTVEMVFWSVDGDKEAPWKSPWRLVPKIGHFPVFCPSHFQRNLSKLHLAFANFYRAAHRCWIYDVWPWKYGPHTVLWAPMKIVHRYGRWLTRMMAHGRKWPLSADMAEF